ncbi:hypothetical protein PABG_03366 [Paracoccidioides brasiliensis Pb03]|uniref:Uncharacterized protein n=1 Tax=Paracoccidioides brasiliensis TaxID=121759 RepID=A0A1D2JGB0_PARBR|nr:hypothetical protein PABG_03366 [Paracoccidioides brasiliensis Pb03]ODH33129.1 hypothetical protein ACO22_03321 [Paracoccidioides brasiliensis]ODH53054.1 hypothetical protein GX48_00924 [Paracoccidioides brasiliensis]
MSRVDHSAGQLAGCKARQKWVTLEGETRNCGPLGVASSGEDRQDSSPKLKVHQASSNKVEYSTPQMEWNEWNRGRHKENAQNRTQILLYMM